MRRCISWGVVVFVGGLEGFGELPLITVAGRAGESEFCTKFEFEFEFGIDSTGSLLTVCLRKNNKIDKLQYLMQRILFWKFR